MKRNLFLIFIALITAFPLRPAGWTYAERLSREEKVTHYVKGLISGNPEVFFTYNAVYLAQAHGIKQNFPQAMWEQKLAPIKEKWKKRLSDSVGTVKEKKLWDYLYEPGSGVKATLLEVRPGQEKAFIKIEYPNIQTAPDEGKIDTPGIQEVILDLAITNETFDPEEARIVEDSLKYYPFIVPDSLTSCVSSLLDKQVGSTPKSVFINREICVKMPEKDNTFLNFLVESGFNFTGKISIIQDKDSRMLVRCCGLIHPGSWQKYIIAPSFTGTTQHLDNRIEYYTTQESRLEIQKITMRDKISGWVLFTYHCPASNPVYAFFARINKHFGSELEDLVDFCSIQNLEYFSSLEDGKRYWALCRYSNAHQWHIVRQSGAYFNEYSQEKE